MEDKQTPPEIDPGAGLFGRAPRRSAEPGVKERYVGEFIAIAIADYIAQARKYLKNSVHKIAAAAGPVVARWANQAKQAAATIRAKIESAPAVGSPEADPRSVPEFAPIVPTRLPTAGVPAASTSTAGALAAIVEVRRRIKPELQTGHLVGMIPRGILWLAVLAIAVGVGLAVRSTLGNRLGL